jgi:hypothetical protein
LGALLRASSSTRDLPPADRNRVASPSPSRLDDLDLVAIMERVPVVLAAGHDLAVDFDRDPAFAMAGLGEQCGNRR